MKRLVLALAVCLLAALALASCSETPDDEVGKGTASGMTQAGESYTESTGIIVGPTITFSGDWHEVD